MTLTPVTPPTRSRGKQRRYSPGDIENAAALIVTGEFLSDADDDRGPAKSSAAAFQRGRTVRNYLVDEQGFSASELMIRTWEEDGGWHWAIGLRPTS